MIQSATASARAYLPGLLALMKRRTQGFIESLENEKLLKIIHFSKGGQVGFCSAVRFFVDAIVSLRPCVISRSILGLLFVRYVLGNCFAFVQHSTLRINRLFVFGKRVKSSNKRENASPPTSTRAATWTSLTASLPSRRQETRKFYRSRRHFERAKFGLEFP